MFEDSTFESTGRIRTRSGNWMMASFTFNGTILVALILIPLIYPEALPRQMMNILLEGPPPPPAPAQPLPPPAPREAFHGAPQMAGATLVAPRLIPDRIREFAGPEAPAPTSFIGLDTGPDGDGGVHEAFGGQRHVTVTSEAPKGPVRLLSTIVAGMLLHKTIPAYPPIALAAHVEGTVVLQATISAAGTIENLRVVSGPAMLQQTALEAVSNWRYRPYLLNGQPVEVETTVNVIFSLNH